MLIETVGAVGIGDMGGAVAAALKSNGLRVMTVLEGRSERSRFLASDHGFEDAGSIAGLVEECDLILSILAPATASAVARSVADCLNELGGEVVFADCNAISPQTANQMAKTITDAGGRYVDGGIIGGPPRTGYAPRFYVSGTHRAALLELDGKGIQVMDVGDEIGRASAIKMCYASMTKGINALQTAMMSASARLGVYDELVAELETSQSAALERIEASVQRLPSVAGRWIGEMEEIAATFESVGVTGDFHKGAAAIFRLADSATIESDKTRDMESTIKAFAARIEQ